MNEKRTFIARIIEGGRVTVPDMLREFLKLENGDLVELTIVKVEDKKGAD